MTIDITTIPTLELLAEVDRRAREAQPPRVLFFGVWPGERAGHFVRNHHGDMVDDEGRVGFESSFGKVRHGSLYPWNAWRRAQDEGKVWHWHHPARPFTLLTSWDRSADQRTGCAASFIVFAHVTPQHGLELARAAFPRVFERIEKHLGRAVELAGEVPQE